MAEQRLEESRTHIGLSLFNGIGEVGVQDPHYWPEPPLSRVSQGGPYLANPVMLHFNHVEGIVGPAPFLVKLHVSGQTFESYLQAELDAEQRSCQLSSFVSCLFPCCFVA